MTVPSAASLEAPRDRACTRTSSVDGSARWIEEHVPAGVAARPRRGVGAAAIRCGAHAGPTTRRGTRCSRASGLVAPTWPVEYGGARPLADEARVVEAELAPFNLGRLNPLGPEPGRAGAVRPRHRGAAAAVPAPDRRATRRCGASSSASRAPAPTWRRSPPGPSGTGTNGWSPARRCGAPGRTCRTSASCWPAPIPTCPSAAGSPTSSSTCTSPASRCDRCATSPARSTSTRCSSTTPRVPDAQRVGEVGGGWNVANATLSGERQMVSGAGSGGVDRIGGSGVEHVWSRWPRNAGAGRPTDGQTARSASADAACCSEERIRDWTNQRVRAGLKAGRPPGPESSVGKVHQGDLNQRIQLLATDLLGAAATAWRTTPPPTSTAARWGL